MSNGPVEGFDHTRMAQILRLVSEQHVSDILSYLSDRQCRPSDLVSALSGSERSIYRKLHELVEAGIVKKAYSGTSALYELTLFGEEVEKFLKHFNEMAHCNKVYKGLESMLDNGYDIDLAPLDRKSLRAVYVSQHKLGRMLVLTRREKITQSLSNVLRLTSSSAMLSTRYFNSSMYNELLSAAHRNVDIKVLLSSSYDVTNFVCTVFSHGPTAFSDILEKKNVHIRLGNMLFSYYVGDKTYLMIEMPRGEGVGYYCFLSVSCPELACEMSNMFSHAWKRSIDLKLDRLKYDIPPFSVW